MIEEDVQPQPSEQLKQLAKDLDLDPMEVAKEVQRRMEEIEFHNNMVDSVKEAITLDPDLEGSISRSIDGDMTALMKAELKRRKRRQRNDKLERK